MTESEPRVAGLLLAAGGSSRLGRPKQLIELDGRTLIRRAAEALINAGCSKVVVVLGAEIIESTKALDGLGVGIATNDEWELGMSSSIAAGIRSLEVAPSDAVLVTLCDQPFVTSDHLRKFIDDFTANRPPIIAAEYNGIAGVPALFSKVLFPALRRLTGEKGARELIRNEPNTLAIRLPEAAIDIDTASDVAELTQR